MAYRVPSFLFLAALLVGATFLSARSLAADEPAKPEASKTEVNLNADYILQPRDLLHFQVFQEEELTREIRISQENSINLPLIGSIDTKGISLRQLEERVRSLYEKDYLVNPQITLVIKEYAKRTVDIQGQVGQPGAVEFPQERGMDLYGAITRASGFTRLADKTRVLLTRRFPDGHTETFKINVTEIIEGKAKERWPLQLEDTIFVPERIL
jgi:polysaccharide export outer membrane protein